MNVFLEAKGKGVAALMPGREALLMMGTKERSFAPLVHVSLEELVQQTYARGGRPSIDPVVFFKLQLVIRK